MGRAANIRRRRKNKAPIKAALIVNTGSAGTLPSQVSRKKVPIRSQKWNWRRGHSVAVGARPKVFERRGKAAIAKIAHARTMTPPNLWGIARRRAYTHKKYHSGLMWAGVTRGSAGMKLSGSAKKSGARKLSVKKRARTTRTPITSFTV